MDSNYVFLVLSSFRIFSIRFTISWKFIVSDQTMFFQCFLVSEFSRSGLDIRRKNIEWTQTMIIQCYVVSGFSRSGLDIRRKNIEWTQTMFFQCYLVSEFSRSASRFHGNSQFLIKLCFFSVFQFQNFLDPVLIFVEKTQNGLKP